jgi:hypothetical protein
MILAWLIPIEIITPGLVIGTGVALLYLWWRWRQPRG